MPGVSPDAHVSSVAHPTLFLPQATRPRPVRCAWPSTPSSSKPLATTASAARFVSPPLRSPPHSPTLGPYMHDMIIPRASSCLTPPVPRDLRVEGETGGDRPGREGRCGGGRARDREAECGGGADPGRPLGPAILQRSPPISSLASPCLAPPPTTDSPFPVVCFYLTESLAYCHSFSTYKPTSYPSHSTLDPRTGLRSKVRHPLGTSLDQASLTG